MSYDVTLSIDTGAGNSAEVLWRNMTSNVAPMWRAAGVNLAEFKDWPAWRAIDSLSAAIDNMQNYPDDYRQMEPDNGWGSYEGCLDFLTSIRDACKAHPRAQIHVSH